MSLYNMLHGFEPTAPVVLNSLQVQPRDIPRFRDAYVTYRDVGKPDGDIVMVILTRTGGGNRDDYVDENQKLRQLSGYIDDVDDEFDVTFALFRYRLPDELVPNSRDYLTQHGAPLTLRQKTEQAIGPDQTVRQKQATERIAQQLSGLFTESK